MESIAHLRRAKEAIHGAGSARSRLQTAGNKFWEALLQFERWPPELDAEAVQIINVLFAKGAIDETVLGMDETTNKRRSSGSRISARGRRRSWE